jgi:hypothetical protein
MEQARPHSRERVLHRAIDVRTHLYSSFATRQTARLCATLDLFLMTPTGQHALVALRRQLVSHRIELRAHVAHVHRLPVLRMSWMSIVLRHTVLWRREGRAHGLLRLLRLRLRLLSVLQSAYGRQVERWQRHVGDLRRPPVAITALLALGRRVGVRCLH